MNITMHGSKNKVYKLHVITNTRHYNGLIPTQGGILEQRPPLRFLAVKRNGVSEKW